MNRRARGLLAAALIAAIPFLAGCEPDPGGTGGATPTRVDPQDYPNRESPGGLVGCDPHGFGPLSGCGGDGATGQVQPATPAGAHCDPHGFGPLSGCSGDDTNGEPGRGVVPDEGLTQADMAEAARHEAGHAVVMEAEGGTVTSSVIRSDGSGETAGSNLPADVMSQVMVDVAGAVGAGTDAGALKDFRDAVDVMRALSPAQREAMVNQARAKDAQILRERAAEFDRITADLLDDGRLG